MNTKKENKLIWTAEEIIRYDKTIEECISHYFHNKKPLFYNKQFLDADKVKRIIEDIMFSNEMNEEDYLIRVEELLKRLGLK